MQEQDKERIRQALEAALEELDARAENSVTLGGAGAGPLVFLLGNPNTTRSAQSDPDIERPGVAPSEEPATHPGHQRFAILETDSRPSVPKPCFMEPERKCVRSGACEMRGF